MNRLFNILFLTLVILCCFFILINSAAEETSSMEVTITTPQNLTEVNGEFIVTGCATYKYQPKEPNMFSGGADTMDITDLQALIFCTMTVTQSGESNQELIYFNDNYVVNGDGRSWQLTFNTNNLNLPDFSVETHFYFSLLIVTAKYHGEAITLYPTNPSITENLSSYRCSNSVFSPCVELIYKPN